MLIARYKTKKALKHAVGEVLRYQETSAFGPEYSHDGKFCVVGPGAYDRKWYAEVQMAGGLIAKVK